MIEYKTTKTTPRHRSVSRQVINVHGQTMKRAASKHKFKIWFKKRALPLKGIRVPRPAIGGGIYYV